ncbi:MAG: cell wall-binding protein [Erysipelotrichia bacterium]|nr:cell wall-binding protein [Erysipelotrichia bacterium]NCC55324.1 cell wall-binding protein [Erysipelotrichia bacterium]
MKKKVTILFTSLIVVVACIMSISSNNAKKVQAISYEGFDAKETLPENHVFTTMNENGEIVEMDVASMEEEVKQEIANKELMVAEANGGIGGTENITNGVVNFRTKANYKINTYYTEDGTNKSGYLNGFYGTNAAFIGHNNDGSKIKFMMAGVVGWVNSSDVEVLNYDDSNAVKSVDHYQVNNGVLNHYYTSNIRGSYYSSTVMVGYKQSYMDNNSVYYSYDGHYFYTTYAQMISDYKNNTRDNAINPTNPYYNYYQFLSHRSKTNITASMLDEYVNKQTNKETSKMKNMGQYFIQYQDTYGSNALLMFSVAANESAWGNSDIAQAKNNLFGHAAYDSSAGSSSTGYYSPQMSIYSHAKYFVSEGYLDPLDYDGRYYGAHLGDKSSGMNVKYASDPYWGEKNAAIAWQVVKANASSNDASKYTLAIKDKGLDLNVRSEATSSSAKLYSTGTAGNYPFIVLDKVSGQSVNGNTTWYKIQSDSTLNSARTAITRDQGEYDFNQYYAYVSSAYVNIVGSEKGFSPGYIKGDVNGDGYISSKDYNTIKNHITKYKVLTDEFSLLKADVNEDGYISSKDYNAIKNHINGTKKLF